MRTRVVPPKSSFERLLLESLDDALTDLFGENSKKVIYISLKSEHGIAREEIPDRLADFDLALREMFGRSSRALHRVIVKSLYSRMHLEFFERPDYGLLDYVADAMVLAQPFLTELSCERESSQPPVEEEAM